MLPRGVKVCGPVAPSLTVLCAAEKAPLPEKTRFELNVKVSLPAAVIVPAIVAAPLTVSVSSLVRSVVLASISSALIATVPSSSG